MISAGSTSGACSDFFPVGTVVTMTPTPTGNDIFGGWEQCGGVGSCSVTVTQPIFFRPTFNAGTAQSED